MQVTFRTSYGDIVAFNFHYMFSSRIFIGLLVVIIGLGINPNWQMAATNTAGKPTLYTLAWFAVLELAPVVFAIILMTVGLFIANLSKMNKAVLADRTITLGEDAILSESASQRSEVKWAEVQKTVRTRWHIFLYLRPSGAIVIPKRTFVSADAYDQFWEACQDKAKSYRKV